MRSSLQLLVLIAAFSTGAVVQAQDENQARPRFHIGVGIGRSHLGPEWDSVGVPEQIQPHKSAESGKGWRVVAGFRPLRVVGAEIEYVDLGEAETRDNRSPNASISLGNYSLKSKARAAVLTALLFIPDPSPMLDVYGKVGVAKLEESFDVFVSDWSLPCRIQPFGQAPSCLFDSHVDRTDSHPYLGIGARFKVAAAWAVRLEYEAIDGDIGDKTTMVSIGIAWER